LYDSLSRIIETGEVKLVSKPSFTHYLVYEYHSDTIDNAWEKSQITRTIYDKTALGVAYFGSEGQNNLLGRVANRYYQSRIHRGTHFEPLDSLEWATHYSYDVAGNVKTMIHEIPLLTNASQSNNAFKKLDYEYDLVSGKVNALYYQKDQWDQFIYKYEYDAQNRLIQAKTSCDGSIWDLDANYLYHNYGPLARVELGTSKVQGLDYAYTTQGWIKGVNSGFQEPECDIGRDALDGSNANHKVARDAFGYVLGYYELDYLPVRTTLDNEPLIFDPLDYTLASGANPLYNGNIAQIWNSVASATTTNGTNFKTPLLSTYSYDQLQRLRSQQCYNTLYNINNPPTITSTEDYYKEMDYDAAGNIQYLKRHGLEGGQGMLKMDSLIYTYQSNSNRLEYIDDDINWRNRAN